MLVCSKRLLRFWPMIMIVRKTPVIHSDTVTQWQNNPGSNTGTYPPMRISFDAHALTQSKLSISVGTTRASYSHSLRRRSRSKYAVSCSSFLISVKTSPSEANRNGL